MHPLQHTNTNMQAKAHTYSAFSPSANAYHIHHDQHDEKTHDSPKRNCKGSYQHYKITRERYSESSAAISTIPSLVRIAILITAPSIPTYTVYLHSWSVVARLDHACYIQSFVMFRVCVTSHCLDFNTAVKILHVRILCNNLNQITYGLWCKQ